MTTETRRDPVTPDRVFALPHHPKWDDGRKGFVWCRFDALLTTDARHLRAEITWDDDSEDEDNEEGERRTLFDADLWIETNAVKENDRLETLDGFHVPLSFDEAARLLTTDPQGLLVTYAERIAQLKVAA